MPSFPPNGHKMQQSLDKVNIIVKDSGCTACVVSPNVESIMRFYRIFDVLDVPIFFAGDLNKTQLSETVDEYSDALLKRLSRNDILFLQYTSGSTGSPKGVVVKHSNMLYQIGKIIYSQSFMRRCVSDFVDNTDTNKMFGTGITIVVRLLIC